LRDRCRSVPQVSNLKRKDKARPFVPTEIRVSTVEDDKGTVGILSILTTEGLVEIALDLEAAEALAKAVNDIRARLVKT